jgi:hypothetical protein
MLQKSLQLYPLPGVEALLSHAIGKLTEPPPASSNAAGASSGGEGATSSSTSTNSRRPTAAPVRSASINTGTDGRAYTEEHVRIVKEVLQHKEGGRGAHYRVLNVQPTCTESDLKKVRNRTVVLLKDFRPQYF